MDGHPVVLTPKTYLGMAQNLLTFNGHNFLTPDGHWGQIAFALFVARPPKERSVGFVMHSTLWRRTGRQNRPWWESPQKTVGLKVHIAY